MTQQSKPVATPVQFEITRTDAALHNAPVIYVDGAQTFIANEHMVKFNLIQDRLVGSAGVDPSMPLERVVCARLVMTSVAFLSLADWMGQQAAHMRDAQAQAQQGT